MTSQISVLSRLGRHKCTNVGNTSNIFDAYEAVVGVNVIDRSDRRPGAVMRNELERFEGPAQAAGQTEVALEVFVVDQDGTQRPFHPDLLTSSSNRSSNAPDETQRHAEVRSFEWPKTRSVLGQGS